MPAKRRALGRGLDALLPTSQGAEEEAEQQSKPVSEIELDAIVPNPYQPRKVVEDAALQELAESIRAQGVIQPIIVRRIDRMYQLIAGERRWRASRMAGLTAIPAMVVELDEREMLEWALIENLQREDLNAIEEARAYQTLLQEFSLSQEEVAQRVGKQRSSVANALRLLKLPEEVQLQIAQGVLTAGHGRALLAVTDAAKQRELHNEIIRRSLSVRQAEQLAIKAAGPDAAPRQSAKKESDAQLTHLANQLSERLGTKVAVKPTTAKSGRLEIYYFSLEDLDRIIDQIAGNDSLDL